MGRALLAPAAVFVCAFLTAAIPTAQTTAPPDGWVVLPIDEYRALRERANPARRSRWRRHLSMRR